MLKAITCDEFVAEMRWYVNPEVLSDEALEIIFDHVNEFLGPDIELTESVKDYIVDTYRETSIWDLMEQLDWLLARLDDIECMPPDILALIATDELIDSDWRSVIGETSKGLVYLEK
jgi:hypothetical protein